MSPEGELGSRDRKLREPASMLGPPRMHEVRRVEVADLAGDVAGVGRGVESGDVVDGRLARDQVLPERLFADPIGGDDAQPCNNYAPGVPHQTVPPKGAPVKVG
jgi:hypothetical protein